MNTVQTDYVKDLMKGSQLSLEQALNQAKKENCNLEVKGCTLEVDGVGYFPDAPTERGGKHLRELIEATELGYRCAVAFVIQMEGIHEVRPNVETHPKFGEALEEARQAGVQILGIECRVTENGLWASNYRRL